MDEITVAYKDINEVVDAQRNLVSENSAYATCGKKSALTSSILASLRKNSTPERRFSSLKTVTMDVIIEYANRQFS